MQAVARCIYACRVTVGGWDRSPNLATVRKSRKRGFLCFIMTVTTPPPLHRPFPHSSEKWDRRTSALESCLQDHRTHGVAHVLPLLHHLLPLFPLISCKRCSVADRPTEGSLVAGWIKRGYKKRLKNRGCDDS